MTFLAQQVSQPGPIQCIYQTDSYSFYFNTYKEEVCSSLYFSRCSKKVLLLQLQAKGNTQSKNNIPQYLLTESLLIILFLILSLYLSSLVWIIQLGYSQGKLFTCPLFAKNKTAKSCFQWQFKWNPTKYLSQDVLESTILIYFNHLSPEKSLFSPWQIM